MKRGCLILGIVSVGLFIGWFVWAVGQGREGARRAQCISHLKWLGLVFHNYHSQHGSLPPGTIPNPHLPPEQRLSWVVEIWDVTSSGLMLNIDRSKGWNEPPNTSPRMFALKGVTLALDPESTGDWVACPDDPAYHPQKKPSTLTYVGMAGVGANAPTLPSKHPRAGVFGFDRVTKYEDITDGLSQTMMVIETTRNRWRLDGGRHVERPWRGPGNATVHRSQATFRRLPPWRGQRPDG